MGFFRLLLVFFLISGPVFAEEPQGVLVSKGVGQVAVAPDVAMISVGVEVQAPTADRALRLNSARMKEVLALLDERGIAPKDIQTTQFSLHPQWQDKKSSYDQPLAIAGFVVTNVVNVRIVNLGMLGAVLDSLTKAGANRIQSVRFLVSEPQPHLDEARQLAIIEARRKALMMAEAAGVTLGPILSIEEAGSGPDPVFRAEAAFVSAAAPIAEGELALSAEVTIRFAIK